MRAYITAAVRTAVQALIGLLVGLPILDALEVSDSAVTGLETFLTAVAVGAVTIALRWFETRFPILTPILSLGTTKAGPTYQAPPSGV